jgi:hypothetical protein
METTTLTLAVFTGVVGLPGRIFITIATFSDSPAFPRPIMVYFAAVCLAGVILAACYALPRLSGMS